MRYIINSFKFLIFSLFILSCEERVELDFVEFNPGSLSDNDGKIRSEERRVGKECER